MNQPDTGSLIRWSLLLDGDTIPPELVHQRPATDGSRRYPSAPERAGVFPQLARDAGGS